MYLTLSQIKYRVGELAKIIEAPTSTLPTFGRSEQTGRPHIEVDDKGYHYVVAERGHEFERHTTSDLDELLYNIFQSVTFTLACSYELKHRKRAKDFRRIMFVQQEELLSQLNQSWGERRRLEHEEILKRSPFDDYASIRATYCKDLRDQGYSVEEAREIAYSKYPIPKESED